MTLKFTIVDENSKFCFQICWFLWRIFLNLVECGPDPEENAMYSVKPLALLLGGIAMLNQIIMLRAFMAIFWGNELIVGFLLAIWMAFSGLGSWIGNGIGRARSRPCETLALSLQGISLFSGVTVLLLLPGARILLQIPTAEYLTINHLFLLALPAIVPIVLPLGISFALLARAASASSGNPAALIYVYDAAGSIIASLLFTFVLVHWFTPVQSLLIAALLLTATAGQYLGRPAWTSLVALLLLALVILSPGVEQKRAAAYWRSFAPGMNLVDRTASPHGELAVVEWGGDRSLFSNGALQAVLPNPIDSQAQAALLMNQPLPDPARVLLIGGGLGGLAPELARYPEAGITYIELDRQAVELALAALPDSLRTPWRNPRLKILYRDGRHFLQRDTLFYSLIVINTGRPSGALANRYYTEEFFALAKERLASGGVLALLNIPSGENYLGPELLRLNRSLYAGLGRCFERIVVIPGNDAILLAGNYVSLTTEPAELAARLAQKNIDLNHFFPAMFAGWLNARRISSMAEQLSGTGAWRNLDFRPVAYFTDLTLWQKMAQGGSSLLLTLERMGYGMLLLIWTGMLLTAFFAGMVWRRAAGAGRAGGSTLLPVILLTAFSIGMAATAFDILFIMAMQNLFGSLYESIGLALAAFMAGMTGGSWLVLHIAPRRRVLPLILLLGLTALCGAVLTPLFAFISAHPAQSLFYLALLGASGLTGAVFPLLCALHDTHTGAGRWGTVNAADLTGGAAGALLIGGVWVPLFGFARTLYLVGTTNLVAALALLLFALPLEKEAHHD
jgi:spermidine synthase